MSVVKCDIIALSKILLSHLVNPIHLNVTRYRLKFPWSRVGICAPDILLKDVPVKNKLAGKAVGTNKTIKKGRFTVLIDDQFS